MRRDCMKCPHVWIPLGCDYPEGCGYGVEGSRPIGTRCYKDGVLLKNYEYIKPTILRQIHK